MPTSTVAPVAAPAKNKAEKSRTQELEDRFLELEGTVAAIGRSQAVIEFDVTGKIIAANENFLGLLGYSADEVIGKHHRMFCDPEYVRSFEYQEFWEKLGNGEFHSDEFKRYGKNGKEVWIQATYNPILDANGEPTKVVKFASDVTQAKLENAEVASRMAAINRAQAVIEFDLKGNILTANENFLGLLGYTLSEVAGKHHRMFCEEEYTATQAYAEFWDKLGNGSYEAGEYKRLGKGGKEVWIQATYNPILDLEGRPTKVVKFASDVTGAKLRHAEVVGKMEAVDRAQAAIEFDLEGYVIGANENFLRVMGYSLREITGQHHSMFCSDDYKRSPEYRDFWMRLGKGEFISGRFHRVGKFERNVHIQAAYNPIFDLSGQPVKVVKYAYDVTESVERESRVATSTNEMTSAVKQLSGTIQEIAASSAEARKVTASSAENTGEGIGSLRSSIEAVSQIDTSTRSIADIVRTMGDIASETNLLAFNASIEAARAGEHGVGFSIVANEVRKLAERSAEAAQQISNLVEESVIRVTRGAEVCNEARGSFEKVSTTVDQAGEIVSGIEAVVKVQQNTFAEIEKLIAQVAEVHAS